MFPFTGGLNGDGFGEEYYDGTWDGPNDASQYVPRRHIKTNPLFYHEKVEIIEEKRRTDKAVLLRLDVFGGVDVWVPLSWCKEWTDSSVFIWREGLIKNIKKTYDTCDT